MLITVCDDQKETREYLTEMIRGCDEAKAMPVYSFATGEELLSFCKENTVDLIFLDIEMEGMNGVDIANRLLQEKYGAFIIFVTNYTNYMKDAFRASAFQYLVKPVSKEDVELELGRAIVAYRNNHMQYCCKKYADETYLNYEDILYLESSNKKKFVHTMVQAYESMGSLAEDVEKMEQYDFIQCHKSYLVNMNKIRKIEKNSIVLTDGTELPVSKAMKAGMVRAFTRFIERRRI